MYRKQLFGRLAGLLALLLVGLSVAAPAQAAAPAQKDECVRHKRIENWKDLDQLDRKGFNVDLVGDQASITFDREEQHKFLSLNLAADPTSAQYTASRITEIDSTLPIDQRVKCWQPTPDTNVVVEFVVRFDQAAPPPGLTENLILWNAPFPSPGSTEPSIPLTAIGVTRNGGEYAAIVAQDLDFSTFSGFLVRQPLPAWLDATDWHSVRITVSETSVLIELAQGEQDYTPVLLTELPHPVEPLGFEFSVDNEAFPGFFVPVTVPDSLDVDFLDIHLAPAH